VQGKVYGNCTIEKSGHSAIKNSAPIPSIYGTEKEIVTFDDDIKASMTYMK